MGKHTIPEAASNLNELIDRALAGEGVVITREGEAVVEIRPCAKSTEKRITPEGLARIAAQRPASNDGSEHAGELVSRLRDEGEK